MRKIFILKYSNLRCAFSIYCEGPEYKRNDDSENCAILWHILFSLEPTLRYQENDLATFNISCAVKFLTLSQISDHKELPTLGLNEKKKGKF